MWRLRWNFCIQVWALKTHSKSSLPRRKVWMWLRQAPSVQKQLLRLSFVSQKQKFRLQGKINRVLSLQLHCNFIFRQSYVNASSPAVVRFLVIGNGFISRSMALQKLTTWLIWKMTATLRVTSAGGFWRDERPSCVIWPTNISTQIWAVICVLTRSSELAIWEFTWTVTIWMSSLITATYASTKQHFRQICEVTKNDILNLESCMSNHLLSAKFAKRNCRSIT